MARADKTLSIWAAALGGLWLSGSCSGATPVIATSMPSTHEHVMLKTGSAQADAITKSFPGRLRKRPTPPAAFRLNNVFIEAPVASVPEPRTLALAEDGEQSPPRVEDFPTELAPVAAPRPNTAQSPPGSSLVAAVPPTAATGDLLRCGARTPTTLTVCLNPEQGLNKLDRIAVLAFTQDPSVAYVAGETERAVLSDALASLPNQLEIADLRLPTDQNELAGTAGRIHFVRKP